MVDPPEINIGGVGTGEGNWSPGQGGGFVFEPSSQANSEHENLVKKLTDLHQKYEVLIKDLRKVKDELKDIGNIDPMGKNSGGSYTKANMPEMPGNRATQLPPGYHDETIQGMRASSTASGKGNGGWGLATLGNVTKAVAGATVAGAGFWYARNTEPMTAMGLATRYQTMGGGTPASRQLAAGANVRGLGGVPSYLAVHGSLAQQGLMPGSRLYDRMMSESAGFRSMRPDLAPEQIAGMLGSLQSGPVATQLAWRGISKTGNETSQQMMGRLFQYAAPRGMSLDQLRNVRPGTAPYERLSQLVGSEMSGMVFQQELMRRSPSSRSALGQSAAVSEIEKQGASGERMTEMLDEFEGNIRGTNQMLKNFHDWLAKIDNRFEGALTTFGKFTSVVSTVSDMLGGVIPILAYAVGKNSGGSGGGGGGKIATAASGLRGKGAGLLRGLGTAIAGAGLQTWGSNLIEEGGFLRTTAGAIARGAGDFLNPIGGLWRTGGELRDSATNVWHGTPWGGRDGGWGLGNEPGVGDPSTSTYNVGDSSVLHQRTHHGESHVHGLNPEFKRRLEAMFKANPKLKLTSGYRSPQRQKELWDAAVKKYGSPEAARKWVAPPGKSNHGKGIAADIGPASEYGWLKRNAPAFGLDPYAPEPWHWELSGTRSGGGPGDSFGISGSAAALSASGGGGGGTRGGLAGRELTEGAYIASLLGTQGSTGGAMQSLRSASGQAVLGAGGGEAASGSAGQIANWARAAGFSGQSLITAVAIALGESSGNPGAQGDQALANGKWGNSVGLWQIRSLNAQRGSGQSRDASMLTNPSFNARSAYEISGGGSDFSPWTVYKSGKYRQYLDTARSAVMGSTGSTSHMGDAPVSAPAPVMAAPAARGASTVNITLKIERASDEEAERFAHRVKRILESERRLTTVGSA